MLNVSSNKLEKITEKTFYALTKLEDIDLENNQLDSIEFKDLVSLRNLTLSYNRLRNINSKSFANLPQIAQITLKYNKIERLETNSFKDLINLEKIDLAYNKLKIIDPEAIGLYKDLKSFKKIILTGNQIEKIDFITFVKLIRIDKSNVRHFRQLKVNDINFFPDGLEKLSQSLVDELVRFAYENNLTKYLCVGLMLKCGLYMDDVKGTDTHKQILEYIFAVKFTESGEFFKGFTEFLEFMPPNDEEIVYIDNVKKFILTYLVEELNEDIYFR